jgi:hypothetical protein
MNELSEKERSIAHSVVDAQEWGEFYEDPNEGRRVRLQREASVARALAAYRAELTREVVICAAIRLPDGRIFRGHRHGDCIRTARDSVNCNGGVDPWREGDGVGRHEYWTPDMCGDQGFITSANRYVDRKEGMRLQLAAGIESVAKGGYRGQLYSEDLY